MKVFRFTAIVMVMSVLLGGFQLAHAQIHSGITAETAILIDATTGLELFSKNPDRVMYPASTTKIMTTLLAVEHGDLDEIITVGQEVNMIAWDSSRANLRPGDKISLRDLLYGLMLASGNDAAYTVAVHIARNVAENPSLSAATALKDFASLMNQRAKELGAKNTNFVNPDGYPHRSHYTTARDLALITAEAMSNPGYKEFDSTAHYSPKTWTGGHVQSWNNGNFLIRQDREFYYEKAVGGKTGFTHPAGFTMVATAGHDDMELVAVALKTNANGRWQDTISMLEFGFENFTRQRLLTKGQRAVSVTVADTEPLLTLIAQDDLFGILGVEGDEQIEKEVILLPELAVPNADSPTLIESPEKGEIVGEMVFSINGLEVGRGSLVPAEEDHVILWLQRLLNIFKF